jgi:hypothetical protein
VRKRARLALHKTSNLSRDKQDAESKPLIDESPALEAIEEWLTIGWISSRKMVANCCIGLTFRGVYASAR